MIIRGFVSSNKCVRATTSSNMPNLNNNCFATSGAHWMNDIPGNQRNKNDSAYASF